MDWLPTDQCVAANVTMLSQVARTRFIDYIDRLNPLTGCSDEPRIARALDDFDRKVVPGRAARPLEAVPLQPTVATRHIVSCSSLTAHHLGLGYFQNRWVESLVDYALILWVPAMLYSASLWLLFLALDLRTRHDSR